MKIIITDAGSRKAYDVANILRNVYDFELILFSSTGHLVQLPLIYGQRVYRLRDDNFELFKEDFLSILLQEKDQEYCYLPLSEETTLNFYQLTEEELPVDITCLLPERETFDLVRNKKRFQTFCENHDLPVPKAFDEHEVMELANTFRPVIAKKNVGAGSVGMRYVERFEQLNTLDELDYNTYLVQEKIESDRRIHGGFYLCKNGKVRSYHGHRRIRTFPPKGGVTVFSQADDNRELERLGASLLEKLNWNGFAMIEFMYDIRTGEWKIIELNPRLWGSVMLSEFCNASLLSNYVKLCRYEPITENPIRTDRYIRWIFPFDLLNMLKGKITPSEFFRLNRYNTCYINFTYGRWYSNLFYILYFTFNVRSIKRYFKKIFS